MTDPARFILRRLSLTGPRVALADIGFVPGVNVVWGASNAGKTSIMKSLDFMMGAGSALPDIEEIQGYERAWLQLDLPRSGRVTLVRSVAGGAFGYYGRAVEPGTEETPERTLSAEHRAKGESLSGFLLSELGIRDRQIARNQNADKNAFTFRHFVPYLFTEETNMIGEWSPIRIAPQSGETFDKNVLKFIVTGVDDGAMQTTKSSEAQRTANLGKIELIDDMISVAEEELKRRWPGNGDLEAQEGRISESIEGLQQSLSEHQRGLDALRHERRATVEAGAEAHERRADISVTLDRFALLDAVYESDVARLEALEEGSAALLAGARRACPLCGADPEHQRHAHGFDEIEVTQAATRAEIAKIRLERSDLRKAILSLEAEREGLFKRAERLASEVATLDERIEGLKPLEASSRAAYEELDRVRDSVRQGLAQLQSIESLRSRRARLTVFKPTTVPRGSVSVGIGGITGHELASTVQSVLHAWGFPGSPTVSFDTGSHDILLNGKDRRANGKGVRALMNAAFKIGVLLHCRSKGLPHPGIIALDSPLLSYRDPLKTDHETIAEDEREVVDSGLKEQFYRFLLSQADKAQFIIIENDRPPFDLPSPARVTMFVGQEGSGDRKGFFPS
ncbi:hypothetical protein [Methylobacterium sp. V23]|uniref:hypothetical protein n=1 Tax=Methylobacterium sp. V23 TaxID=2044878 RepID=UPI000CDAD55F|nr:hypothetical protein [Methylobacterium sp. V23]POR42420.1 hypothetical protein CRT23_13230 [Methylobacterium sp. V23]